MSSIGGVGGESPAPGRNGTGWRAGLSSIGVASDESPPSDRWGPPLPPHRRLQLITLGVGLASILAVTLVTVLFADVTDVEFWRKIGYPGVFVFSVLGSAGVVFAIPGLVAVCGAGGLELNPIVLGLLSGAGEAVGELSGYAIGFGGKSVVERSELYQTVRRLIVRRGMVVLFVVSIIPNPIFDLIGIVAGGVNFPVRKFLMAVWAGKTIKGMAVAYACFYGIKLLPWL